MIKRFFRRDADITPQSAERLEAIAAELDVRADELAALDPEASRPDNDISPRQSTDAEAFWTMLYSVFPSLQHRSHKGVNSLPLHIEDNKRYFFNFIGRESRADAGRFCAGINQLTAASQLPSSEFLANYTQVEGTTDHYRATVYSKRLKAAVQQNTENPESTLTALQSREESVCTRQGGPTTVSGALSSGRVIDPGNIERK